VAMVSSRTSLVVNMKALGCKINSTASAKRSGIMELRRMKESSLMERKMEGAGSSGRTGHTMRATLSMDCFTDMAHTTLKSLTRPSLVSSKREGLKVKENHGGLTAANTKDTSKMERRMAMAPSNLQMATSILASSMRVRCTGSPSL